jgi:iron(III) transport system substrate-binding protein
MVMNTTRNSIFALVYGLTMVMSAACSNQAPPTETSQQPTANPPQAVGEINLYSSRHYDSDQELYDNFTKTTGIKINLVEGKAEELIERLKTEGKSSPADVLITVDVGNLGQAEKEGIFQTISSSKLESTIPENLRNPEGKWFGFSKRARIIVYNTDKVKPQDLSTYEDLANPKWKGKICVRSSSNIYNQSLIASKIAENGVENTEKWVKGLVTNFAREPEGTDTSQIQAVASGLCDVTLVNHYYVARLKQDNDPKNQQMMAKIGVFFPNQKEGGTHINISGAGVVANAPHKDNGIKFLEYLVTPEAQEIFANKNNEFPILTNLTPNPVVASFGQFKESPINVAAYGEKNSEAVKLMDRTGWK